MNLHIPPDLEAKLTQLASETGRTTEAIALHLLASAVDHDVWFKRQVDKGRLADREGDWSDRDEVGWRR